MKFRHMPTPRWPVWVPPRVFQFYCQRIEPSRASTAQTLSGDVGYRTPSTIRIDPRIAAGPPALNSPDPSPLTTIGYVPAPPRPPPPPPPPGPGAALLRPVAPEPSMNPRATHASESCLTFVLSMYLSAL